MSASGYTPDLRGGQAPLCRATGLQDPSARPEAAGVVVRGSDGVADARPHLQRDVFGGGLWMLPPGGSVFGGGAVRATTVLGAGVAMVMWSKSLRRAALCHARPLPGTGGPVDCEDADVAGSLAWLEARWGELGCALPSLQLCLAGAAGGGHEATQTLRALRNWVAARQMSPVQEDVGGMVMRRLTLNLADGAINIAHGGRIGDGWT